MSVDKIEFASDNISVIPFNKGFTEYCGFDRAAKTVTLGNKQSRIR